MKQTMAVCRPGGSIGYVGVPHGVQFDGQQLFFTQQNMLGGPAPAMLEQPRAAALENRTAPNQRIRRQDRGDDGARQSVKIIQSGGSTESRLQIGQIIGRSCGTQGGLGPRGDQIDKGAGLRRAAEAAGKADDAEGHGRLQ